MIGKNQKIECLIFIYGAIIGFIIETIGFILMKRISLIIATNSLWTK